MKPADLAFQHLRFPLASNAQPEKPAGYQPVASGCANFLAEKRT